MSVIWSQSSTITFRICQQKYFFSHVLAKNHKNSSPINKQAYWLKKSVNLEMWAGNVVDTIMNNYVMPIFQQGEIPDFDIMDQEAISLLKRQWLFSKEGKYKFVTESNAKDDYCVLDIHENDEPYTRKELEIVGERVRQSIRNIPKIELSNGELLINLLRNADWIAPNLNNRSVKIGNTVVTPQIDLLFWHGSTQYVVDWKVSNAKNSDYSKQLGVIGTVIYRKREEEFRKMEGNTWMYDLKNKNIALLEVNLLDGNIKEHPFTPSIYGELVDYVSHTSRDFELLSKGRKPNEIPLNEYLQTESVDDYTCLTCTFQHLCNFLIEHSNEYFTTENYREFVRASKLV